jgi:hypothetical protein
VSTEAEAMAFGAERRPALRLPFWQPGFWSAEITKLGRGLCRLVSEMSGIAPNPRGLL